RPGPPGYHSTGGRARPDSASGAAGAQRAPASLPEPHATGTRRDGRRGGRLAEQANCRRLRNERSHRQGTTRAGHAEDAGWVLGRAGSMRRAPRHRAPPQWWRNPTKVGWTASVPAPNLDVSRLLVFIGEADRTHESTGWTGS